MSLWRPPEFSGSEGQFSHLKVELADDQAGCDWALFASTSADDMGLAHEAGSLLPGQNDYILDRVRGCYCWVRLRNRGVNQRFAIERASIRVTPVGWRRR